MQGNGYALAAIGVMAAATLAMRAFPFLLFGRGKAVPRLVLYLGRALPPAIIALLVVYCLKGVHPLAYPYGIPELIAVLCVAALQIWRRNSLISIFGGTAVYMFLIQLVFR